MLFVKTEVRTSTLTGVGLGLFATQAIPANTLCFRWTEGWDRFWLQNEVDALPELARAKLEHFGWRHENGWRMSLDESRYTNHSIKRQNVDWREDGMYATRDIAIGEELFESYEFDPDFSEYADKLIDPDPAPV